MIILMIFLFSNDYVFLNDSSSNSSSQPSIPIPSTEDQVISGLPLPKFEDEPIPNIPQIASANVPDQNHPEKYFNDEETDIEQVLDNTVFRFQVVNKFIHDMNSRYFAFKH